MMIKSLSMSGTTEFEKLKLEIYLNGEGSLNLFAWNRSTTIPPRSGKEPFLSLEIWLIISYLLVIIN